jgi:hypothetical protein
MDHRRETRGNPEFAADNGNRLAGRRQIETLEIRQLLSAWQELILPEGGRDIALRCPRRVQRRNSEPMIVAGWRQFRPLNAGGDAAAQRACHRKLINFRTLVFCAVWSEYCQADQSQSY